MKVRYSHFASDDLEGAYNYIALDNPYKASSFIDSVHKKCNSLAHNPYLYPLRPEFGAGVRLAICKPYRIFFMIDEKIQIVHILRILHSARNISSLL